MAARVEARPHAARVGDPYVGGEHRVQRAHQLGGVPGERYLGGGRLTQRVHPGVGSSGTQHGCPLPDQALQRGLEVGLHRPVGRLTLPAGERPAVILQEHEHGAARRHAPKRSGPAGPFQARKSLRHLTKRVWPD